MKELYLDANAHIPVSKETLKYFTELNSSVSGHGHPSSLTAPGRRAANLIEDSRTKIAELIGATSSSQIIFTYGCTHACEWGLEILFNQTAEKENVRVGPYEHTAVTDVYDKYHKSRITKNHFDYFENNNGKLYNLMGFPLKGSSILMHMQNEFGTVFDVKKFKADRIFSDMSQSLGKIPVNVTELDIDIGAFACHKFGGMNGLGFIYLKDSSWWTPFGTGSRYYTDRTGTPDACMVAASAFALEKALTSFKERFQRCQEFQSTIEPELKSLGYYVVAEDTCRSPNTTFIHKKGAINDLLKLNNSNIYCGLGSACGSHATGVSKSLKNFVYPLEYKTSSPHDFIRMSQWGEYGKKEAKKVIDVLRKT